MPLSCLPELRSSKFGKTGRGSLTYAPSSTWLVAAWRSLVATLLVANHLKGAMPSQRAFLSAMILLLCCCCTTFSQEPRVTRTDLLAAMPSEASRFRLVEASRRWRRGVRTVVVSDGLLSPKLQVGGTP